MLANQAEAFAGMVSDRFSGMNDRMNASANQNEDARLGASLMLDLMQEALSEDKAVLPAICIPGGPLDQMTRTMDRLHYDRTSGRLFAEFSKDFKITDVTPDNIAGILQTLKGRVEDTAWDKPGMAGSGRVDAKTAHARKDVAVLAGRALADMAIASPRGGIGFSTATIAKASEFLAKPQPAIR